MASHSETANTGENVSLELRLLTVPPSRAAGRSRSHRSLSTVSTPIRELPSTTTPPPTRRHSELLPRLAATTECVRLLRQLRQSRRLRGHRSSHGGRSRKSRHRQEDGVDEASAVNERRLQRIKSAQTRLRRLLVAEDLLQPCEETPTAAAAAATNDDTAAFADSDDLDNGNNSSSGNSKSTMCSVEHVTSTAKAKAMMPRVAEQRIKAEPQQPQQPPGYEAATCNNVDSDTHDLVFKLPGPLDPFLPQATSEALPDSVPPQRQQQLPLAPKLARRLPQLPQPPPLGPRASLALEPLMSTVLSEPVLALAFDPIGRRLISAEPSRGLRFRGVTFSGGDLTPGDHLDWHMWVRAACVLPRGHLLVATHHNLQLLGPDGARLAATSVKDKVCGVGLVSVAAHERSAIVLDRYRSCLRVMELPHLNLRAYHPLNRLGGGQLKNPTALCVLRNLLAIAQYDDNLIILEIDTGRLRQSVHVSNRHGPKQLASCNSSGLLFVSVFSECCLHIFKLKGGFLQRAGTLRDASLRPGHLAWLPGNGILFCAGSLTTDGRRCELRSYALREAERTNWTPKAIRLMNL